MCIQSKVVAMDVVFASGATQAADINLEATSVSKAGVNEFNLPAIVVTKLLSQPAHLTLHMVDKDEKDDKVVATSGRRSFDVACKTMPEAGFKTR